MFWTISSCVRLLRILAAGPPFPASISTRSYRRSRHVKKCMKTNHCKTLNDKGLTQSAQDLDKLKTDSSVFFNGAKGTRTLELSSVIFSPLKTCETRMLFHQRYGVPRSHLCLVRPNARPKSALCHHHFERLKLPQVTFSRKSCPDVFQ